MHFWIGFLCGVIATATVGVIAAIFMAGAIEDEVSRKF